MYATINLGGEPMKQKQSKYPPAHELHMEASPINHCYFIVDTKEHVIKIVRDEKAALSFLRTLH